MVVDVDSAGVTFPQELIDLIIDYGHDDKALLGTCGLVCKAWLPSSRHHLFETVKIWTSQNLHALNQLFPAANPVSIPDSFLQYVRGLVFKVDHDTSDSLSIGEETEMRFEQYLSCLPALRSLAIIYAGIPGLAYFPPSLVFPNRITTLKLTKIAFSSVSEMIETISSFSLLECVEINDCRCRGAFETPPPDVARFPVPERLHSVHLTPMDTQRYILNWLTSGVRPGVRMAPMRRLSVFLLGLTSSIELGAFMRARCHELLELQLSLLNDHWNWHTDAIDELMRSLSHLPSLQSLQMVLPLYGTKSILLRIARSIPAPLRRLIISIGVPQNRNLAIGYSKRCLDELAQALRDKSFSQLEKFELQMRYRENDDMSSVMQLDVFREIIGERLGDWGKKGVLKISNP